MWKVSWVFGQDSNLGLIIYVYTHMPACAYTYTHRYTHPYIRAHFTFVISFISRRITKGVTKSDRGAEVALVGQEVTASWVDHLVRQSLQPFLKHLSHFHRQKTKPLGLHQSHN